MECHHLCHALGLLVNLNIEKSVSHTATVDKLQVAEVDLKAAGGYNRPPYSSDEFHCEWTRGLWRNFAREEGR